MTLPHHPHDAFFKQLFTHPEAAEDFVRHYLPVEIVAELEPGSLVICKDSFIDEALAEHYSDLLYRMPLKSGSNAYTYVLFEHKSAPERLITLDVLRYLVRIWESVVKQEKMATLPAILPLVVYHGKDQWRVAHNFQSLIDAPAVFRPYMPEFRYLLTDLSRFSDDAIKGEVMLRLGLLILKYIFRRELPAQLPSLLQALPDLIRHQGGLEFLETVLRYLSTAAPQLREEELHRAVVQALPEGERIMATIAEKWEERGIQQGIQRGLEQERQLLLRQVRFRFGDAIALQSQSLLTQVTDPKRLEDLGEWILACKDKEDWINRLQANIE